MTVYTKLLFGVRTTAEVTLTVVGNVGTTAPQLLVQTCGQPGQTAVDCVNGTWAKTLPPGDHVVRIEMTSDQLFGGSVDITLTPPSTILVVPNQNDGSVTAWSGVKASSDPKNPIPPPVQLDVVSLPNGDWLAATLTQLTKQIVLPARDPVHMPPRRPSREI